MIENESVNQKFRKSTPEYDYILGNYAPGTESDNNGFYTATEFLERISEKTTVFKFTPEKVGKALNALGFEKKSKRRGSVPEYGYYFKWRTDMNIPSNNGTTLTTNEDMPLPF